MTGPSGFLHDSRGATAVEFALVLPLLIAMIVLVIEGNRLLWTKQAIQEAASQTARCMAIGSDGCDTLDGAKLYGQRRAARMGIQVETEAISVSTGQTCHDVADMNKAVIDTPFNSPFGSLIPLIPRRLDAEACFPDLK